MSNQIQKMHGLDTLRALAILLVIPRHAWEILKWPELKSNFGSFGWIGVDLFFVLSGFLIGGQLFAEMISKGQISFKRFYLKRAFRILPAYYFVLLLYFIWPDFREGPNLKPVWSFVLFLMNYGEKADAFSHAWSLCIEEHFYLLFPLIAALIVRFIKSSTIITVLMIGSLIYGMAIRYYVFESGAPFYPDLYRPTHVHLDGLIIGVALAMLRSFQNDIWQRLMNLPLLNFILGLIFVLLGLMAFGPAASARDIYAAVIAYPLISIGFGFVLLASVSSKFWLSKRLPGAEHIAGLAFALYLTHKQIIHLIAVNIEDHKSQKIFVILLSTLLCWVFALAINHLIEKPFLIMRDKFINKNRTLPLS